MRVPAGAPDAVAPPTAGVTVGGAAGNGYGCRAGQPPRLAAAEAIDAANVLTWV
ncbi:hypothetical protein GA0070623_5013 [Micromonospora rifamycinica]|uniref:Uncharacterized protein n=1 Tax=Micromonospora rifamycinica TaxID=291594 RepID=A0A1C5KBY5_9ACTN|nr:hypothetical protein GA0070623_5013 [Micromonospora rifamycinica]